MDFINNFLIAKQILAPILAFLASFYVMPIIIRIAIKKELVAKPNHRTSHKGRIPNIGGVSIFLGFLFALLITINISLMPNLQYFVLGLTCVFFIGLQDDILIISPRKKLYGEIIAILAFVVLGDIRFTHLHNLFNIGEIDYFASIALTTFVIVVIINALNLIDGIDGLASGTGIIASLFFGFYFLTAGGQENIQLFIVSFCLLGALIPFFIYNVFGTRNKIFMGDAGALSLGFIISLLTIKFCETNTPQNSVFINTAPLVAMCVLILPLFDTLRVFIIRLMRGKSPFRPDKNHLHHNLLALGYTHKQTTTILLSFNLIFIIIGVLGRKLPNWVLFLGIISLAMLFSEFVRIKLKNKKEKERELQINYKTTN